jgi:Bacterial Ig-like domain (group 2)
MQVKQDTHTLQKGERMQKLFRSLLAVGALAALAGCGDDVTVTAPPPPDLVISGAPVTAVQVGAKIQLSANQAVSWASSNAAVASVDASGLVSAVAAGTASITATSTADAAKQASVTITVVALAVHSVTVSPSFVTLNPGGTQGFVANVDADPGVARTVTWTSSDAAVATVTAAGVATAVAPGAATITATSTANTSVAGAASVTVRTPTSARVSIQKVTVAGNLNNPVNLAATAGQIDVTIDVDPGDFVAQKVELLVDNVSVGSQSFTSQQSADLTNAHAFADLANAVASTVISFNTAAFNAATGAVAAINLNGPHTLGAKLTVVGGGAGGSATPSLAITFANANTWVATLAFTGTTASATGTSGTSAGLAYKRGGLTITALPVIYNAGQAIVATGSVVNFGSGFCDASGNGTRNVPLTGSGPYTAAFPQTSGGSVATVNSVANYEFSSAACGGIAGEVPTLTAVDNNGNTIFAAAVPTGTTGIRLDNRAPGVPTFMANPNGRQNSWINGTVAIGNNTSATSNNWLVNGTADAGIGGGAVTATSYLRFVRIGDGSAGTVAAAKAATAANTLTTPAPTVSNTSLCAVISAQDELGNESTLPSSSATCSAPPAAPSTPVAAQSLLFGVDIAPPTIAYDASSLADQARLIGGSIGGSFVVTLADTGAVGNSGMLAGTPAFGNTIRRTAAGTTFPADCVVGTSASSNTVCNQSGTNMTYALPLASTGATVSGATIAGYYTFDATAFDAAGNSTPIPAGARVIVYDNTPVTATAPAVPVTITGAFSAAAFLNDDLSIRDYYWTAGFGTALVAPATITLAAAPTVVDAFNAATLSNTNVGINTSINTFLGLQDGTTTPPTAYAAGSNPLNAVNLFARDQTQVAYTGPASAAVAPTAPATGVSVTNFTGAFAPATNAATLCALAAASAGCTVAAATPASATWSATATGATAVFNNPFSRVDFYASNGTDLVLVGSVPAASATLVDNGATRVWTYSLGVSASSLFTQLGGVSGGAPGAAVVTTFYAFGANAAGNVALVSSGTVQTINP